jgi:hypothetical protein
VADRGDTNRLPAVSELIEDAVRADPKRIQTAKPPTKHMPRIRFALQQSQSVLYRVDQRPSQLKQLATSAPGEDEPGQRFSRRSGDALPTRYEAQTK